MLVRLDELTEVEQSFSNHTGTLLRIAPAAGIDLPTVTEAVTKVLEAESRSPVALSGDSLTAALADEMWRDSSRIGELTSIEIRTLVLRGLGYYVLPVLFVVSVGIVCWRRKRALRRSEVGENK